MERRRFIAGLLAVAAPLFSFSGSFQDPIIENGEMKWFELTETQRQVVGLLGPPKLAADFGENFTGWQYQLGIIGDEDVSHYLVFSKKTGVLMSVARNYDPQQNVERFFPESSTKTYLIPTNDPKVPFPVRVRELRRGIFLLAMGVSKPTELCGQIVLIRREALLAFHPDIAAKIAEGPSGR